MTELQQKQLAFLEETANHYNANNRNVDKINGNCMYYPQHDNTEGCAIGRKIQDKELCKRLDIMGSVEQDAVFALLPLELQELEQDFLIEIQCLHDWLTNWDENGLSERGKERVELIKGLFNLVD